MWRWSCITVGLPLQGQNLRHASDAALAEVGPGTVIKAETSDDSNSAHEVDVKRDNDTAYDINLNGSFEVVRVETEDDDDRDRDDRDDNPTQPLTEAERTGASEAALAEAGAGTVATVERDDDGNSTFEVEIVLDDGTEVDVELGPEFQMTISIRLTSEEEAGLDKLAQRSGRSKSFYVRTALHEYLADLEDAFAADSAIDAFEAGGRRSRPLAELKDETHQ